MTRGLEHLSYEERLRELGCSVWRRLWEHFDLDFQYIKGVCKKDGERLFTRACSDRKRSNSFKMKDGRFKWDTERNLFQ